MPRNKRIAITSNYDSEMYNEQFVNLPPMDETMACRMRDDLNSLNPTGPDYYRVVDLDYELKKFTP